VRHHFLALGIYVCRYVHMYRTHDTGRFGSGERGKARNRADHLQQPAFGLPRSWCNAGQRHAAYRGRSGARRAANRYGDMRARTYGLGERRPDVCLPTLPLLGSAGFTFAPVSGNSTPHPDGTGIYVNARVAGHLDGQGCSHRPLLPRDLCI